MGKEEIKSLIPAHLGLFGQGKYIYRCKLGPKTVDYVFLGYAIHSVGYRFLIVNSGVPDMRVGTITESRDATFSTSSEEPILTPEHFAPIEHIDQTPEGNPEEDNNVATRKSMRQSTAKSVCDDYIVYIVDNTPRTIEEAYSSPNANYWKEAVHSEMDSIMSNASHGLLVHQMDVKIAFLNGELEEEIHMDQPNGYTLEGQEGIMCKLLKSLYTLEAVEVLKQAPKQWHEKFDKTLTSAGFVVNEADKCVFYRYGGGERVILCLYVNDMSIFGTSLNLIEEVKDFLSKSFEMKDLGVLTPKFGKPEVIIGLESVSASEFWNRPMGIVKSPAVVFLMESDQLKEIYLEESEFKEDVAWQINTTILGASPPSFLRFLLIIRRNLAPDAGLHRFSSISGEGGVADVILNIKLLRGDEGGITLVQSHYVDKVLSRFGYSDCKGTMSYGIHYAGYPKVPKGYSDSNWISDADEIKATSGDYQGEQFKGQHEVIKACEEKTEICQKAEELQSDSVGLCLNS
uniref:Retrotransposon protein, putative, Ty1-copia subclass n=1 Tax=Oryza sativa subsp. japonica TaxID=39947 RepID=Q7XDW5_ORYSJ|nr:retrotransposon protein, putative, Ty1-copia subclass [Oryza sativa Japonica Group]